MLRTLLVGLLSLFFTLSFSVATLAAQVPSNEPIFNPTFADVQRMMGRASSIAARLDNAKLTCDGSPAFCPPFLNELIADDKSDGYFIDFNFLWVPEWRVRMGAILDSRYPTCAKLMDTKFTGARGFSSSEKMQEFAEKRMFSSMGRYAHTTVRACTSASDSGDQSKVSKFYYASTRLNQGLKDAQSELAKIDAILGGSSLDFCDSVFEDVNAQCKQLKGCPRPSDNLDKVAAQSEADEKTYQASLQSLKASEDQCKSDLKTLGNCHWVMDSSGTSAEFCDRPDEEKLKALQKKCDQEQASIMGDITLLEKVNPWFAQDGYFEGRKKKQSAKSLIRTSLTKTRTALKDVRSQLARAANCLMADNSTGCKVSEFREALASTKWLPFHTGRGQENSIHMAMAAQQCIEEGAVDRDKTGHTLRMAGRDALLTVGTMGVGSVALKGAQLAGKGVEAAAAAKQISTLAAVGVDLLFLGESAARTINSCIIEYDKQKISLEKIEGSDLQCPNPLQNKVASERAGDSCKSSLFDTALNSTPLVGPAVGRILSEFRGTGKSTGWIDRERRRPDIPTTRKTAESVRPANREDLIRQNLTTEFTTVRQNEEWMRLAENTKPDGKTRYFEVENSVMKELNDVTQDKNFVTALTNKHKSIMKEKMDALALKYPGVDIVPYSDFKAMRYALKPRPPATKLPANIEKELAQALQDTNAEFVKFMKDNKLLRDSDKPEEWFRAGYGQTADQATQASRYSRRADGTNRLQNFSDRQLQENLAAGLQGTELYRGALQRDLGRTPLMETISGTDKMTFKPEVFDAVRKTTTKEELMDLVERSTGVKITPLQADQIRDYADLVDDFSPGIHVAQRKIASLTDSTHGGLSLDFAGMGSQNSRATAEALARSENLTDAVVRTRTGERSVTVGFNQRKADVTEAVDSVLKKYGIEARYVDSGDDMVIKPSKPIPAAARQEIANALAQRVPPSSIRVSHVPSGVTREADRAVIGTHGETIEKQMRKALQGQIPKEKLDQTLFQVDMRSTSAGNGNAGLLLSNPRNQLTPSEMERIQRAFRDSIKKLNDSLRSQNLPANYLPQGSILNLSPTNSAIARLWNDYFGKVSQAEIFPPKFLQFSFNF